MKRLQSKRNHIHGSTVAVAALLLIGVLAGPAAAQSTESAAAATTTNTSQDATTRHAVNTNDPFNTFVYDILGATPSIKLPVFLSKPSPAAAGSSNPPSSERAAKRGDAKPVTSDSVQRAETTAGLQ